MSIGFYSKLAWEGIRKNIKMYFPYFLTGSVMVMMFYIISFLKESPAILNMRGGDVLSIVLSLGCGVIAVFSVIFLFYTNSFLIRFRYREFGLYNVLGMDKKNINKIMICEFLYASVITIVSGIAAGIVFSKAAELVLINLVKADITYELSIGISSLGNTVLIYILINLLLLINSIVRVRHLKPLELMHSSKAGEKAPRGNWVLAVIGLILLVIAYVISVTIKEPLTALSTFFVAVLIVIVGTYLLFIAGSVAFCLLLKKNKNYYYRPNHFVSVSSMVYRMKRNGAGLASICILLTMVLVVISFTASLYYGEGNAEKTRYPDGVNINVTFDSIDGIKEENIETIRSAIIQNVDKYDCPDIDIEGIRTCEIPGMITNDGITVNSQGFNDLSVTSYDHLGYLCIISIDDYNHKMNKSEVLDDDECLIYCNRLSLKWDTFTMEYGTPYRVRKMLTKFIDDGETNSLVMPTVYLVVKDVDAFIRPVENMKNSFGESMMMYDWRCGFDMDTAEHEVSVSKDIYNDIHNTLMDKCDIYSLSVESREANRASFFELYGSLFFLGIVLSIVFLFAAVLIIYYKQLSEGYEDQSRFEIMQKVGMTKRDIRKSINSQLLTVFLMPLVMAGVHLGFSFPFLWRMLIMFGLNNMWFIAMVMIICFAVSGLFYAVVYKITSNSYYSIVSGL